MKQNYDKLMLNELEGAQDKRLLLHSCCAPCSSHCLSELAGKIQTTVFYYNPNLDCREEYEKRKSEQQRFLSETGLADFLDADYCAEEYAAAVIGLENEREGGARCAVCFRLRLERTAREAKAGGYDYFATTLTVSPLKNAQLINEIGFAVAEKVGVKYLPSDFKKRGGYLHSVRLSEEYGLYRQDYCGCAFSKLAREGQKLSAFWEKLGLLPPVKTRAEEVWKGCGAELSALPLEALRNLPYEEGAAALKGALGQDEDGMKLFAAQSLQALEAKREYAARGIPEDVFFATMAFLSRFANEAFERSGRPAWTWGWWFPRQLALREFRLGALEFALLAGENGEKGRISVHIPAGADLTEGAVDSSFAAARAFLQAHFPAYEGAPFVCSSWMLSPALQEILPETSHVRRFGARFEVVKWEEDSPAFRDWIFPEAKDASQEDLPETTSLQRAVKRYLLAGGKLGWAEGILK